jgi:hypothetical protein
MKTALRLLILAPLVLPLCGCGRNYDGPERYPLSGKVSYDGEPVDAGTISFLPAGGADIRISGGEIVNGAYSVPQERGANAGTYRVEIRWGKKTGKKYFDRDLQMEFDVRKEGLPPRFHEKSELTADVSDAQTTFDFHLKSK